MLRYLQESSFHFSGLWIIWWPVWGACRLLACLPYTHILGHYTTMRVHKGLMSSSVVMTNTCWDIYRNLHEGGAAGALMIHVWPFCELNVEEPCVCPGICIPPSPEVLIFIFFELTKCWLLTMECLQADILSGLIMANESNCQQNIPRYFPLWHISILTQKLHWALGILFPVFLRSVFISELEMCPSGRGQWWWRL